MQKLSSSAHSVMQYMISRAVLENKVGETVIKIPLVELAADHNDKCKVDDPSGIVLAITINTAWDEGSDEDLEISMDDEELQDV